MLNDSKCQCCQPKEGGGNIPENIIHHLDIFSGIRSADSRLPRRSPTLWPTPDTRDAQPGGLEAEKRRMEIYGTMGLQARALLDSPTAKSSSSPASATTDTSRSQSASEPSRTLRRVRCLSDAVHSRLSSLVAFLASRTAAPESDWRAQMNEIYGMSAPECLGTYDQSMRCSRTSQACLPANGELFSTAYLATWPRFGMLVSGRLYQLPTLERATDAIESGCCAETSWPTPHNREARSDTLNPQRRLDAGKQIMLCHAVRLAENSPAGPLAPASVSTGGSRRELWQTPCSRGDSDGGGHVGIGGGSGAKKTLERQLGRETMLEMTSSKLNPHWVSTLMGYPALWCELGAKFTARKAGRK